MKSRILSAHAKVKRTQYRFRVHKVFLISYVNSSKQKNFTKKCLRFQPSLEREKKPTLYRIIQFFYNKFKCGDFMKSLAPKWRTLCACALAWWWWCMHHVPNGHHFQDWKSLHFILAYYWLPCFWAFYS